MKVWLVLLIGLVLVAAPGGISQPPKPLRAKVHVPHHIEGTYGNPRFRAAY